MNKIDIVSIYRAENPVKETVKKMVKCNVVPKNRESISDWGNVRGTYSLELEINMNKLENNGEVYSLYRRQSGKCLEASET